MVKDILSYGIGTLVGVRRDRRPRVPVHQRHHAEEARRAAQLPGHRAPALFLRAAGRVLPAIFLRRRPRRDAVQPRDARLGLPRWRRTRAAPSASARPTTCTRPGALIFVNHPFPVLEEERLPTPSLMLGEGYCREPFEARSIVNISGMSFGAISAPAVRSLSRGAASPAAGWIPAKAASRPITSKAAATSSCRSAPPSTACATRRAACRPSGCSELVAKS